MNRNFSLALVCKNSAVTIIAAIGLTVLDQFGIWGPIGGLGLIYIAGLISVGYRIET